MKGRVVCINDKYLHPLVNPITKGNEYTIREFIKGYRPEDGGGAPAVYLEEIRNIIYRGHEIGYDANRFREVENDYSTKTRQEPASVEQVY